MPLSVEDLEIERLARDLSDRTGKTITVATRKALEERLHRISGLKEKTLLLEDLAAIRMRCAELKVRDSRSADDLMRYDEHGVPC